MTENNYVIKEDTSKHETLNQCWADVGQCLVFAGTALSQAVAHLEEGSQQRRDIDHLLIQCWPIIIDAGPPLKQHKGNVTCLLGGAHGANRSVTIQLDEGLSEP